jgi:Uma2 family endonuclease
MSTLTERAGQSFTVEDLERLSANGERYELISGELRPMPPSGGEHGSAVHRSGALPERLVVVGDVLRVDDALPGFSVAVSRLFPPG